MNIENTDLTLPSWPGRESIRFQIQKTPRGWLNGSRVTGSWARAFSPVMTVNIDDPSHEWTPEGHEWEPFALIARGNRLEAPNGWLICLVQNSQLRSEEGELIPSRFVTLEYVPR